MRSAMKHSKHKNQNDELHNGDTMSQVDFHRAYKLMPDGYKAELVGGIVFEPSPLGYPHGTSHVRLSYLLESYVIATPGVECADNATVILSDEDEVQPDLVLRVNDQSGGQSNVEDYIQGAPELVAEVAHSSRAIDLHRKKERYRKTGVSEYIVLVLEPYRLFWFDLQQNVELQADRFGVFRSAIFPGLWIHANGLLKLDHELTSGALNAGLESTEHKDFVTLLASRRKSN